MPIVRCAVSGRQYHTKGIVHNANCDYGNACQKPQIAQLALTVNSGLSENGKCQLCDVRFLAGNTKKKGIVHNANCDNGNACQLTQIAQLALSVNSGLSENGKCQLCNVRYTKGIASLLIVVYMQN